jgi:uncharacterized protein
MGIMNLAMLAALGMTDIHAMNALKVVLGSVINGVATVTFVVARAIVWPQAVVTTIGAVLGGYFGAHCAQKLPQAWISGAGDRGGSWHDGLFFCSSVLKDLRAS